MQYTGQMVSFRLSVRFEARSDSDIPVVNTVESQLLTERNVSLVCVLRKAALALCQAVGLQAYWVIQVCVGIVNQRRRYLVQLREIEILVGHDVGHDRSS